MRFIEIWRVYAKRAVGMVNDVSMKVLSKDFLPLFDVF